MKKHSKQDITQAMIQAKKIKRPVLKYYGGKFRLADWIVSHFPKHVCYVEPFGGAGSVLLSKPISQHEIYNDLSSDLVNFFEVLRDDLDNLLRQIMLTPYSQEEHKKAWEYHDDPVERARRFYIRCWASFGEGTTKQMAGFKVRSVDHGSKSQIKDFYNLDALITASARLTEAQIVNMPAIDCIQRFDSEDTLFYVDPPYTHDTRVSTNAYAFEMDDQAHVELAEALHKVKGKVILSGYDSPLYQELYQDWDVSKKIALDLYANEKVECLWLSKGILQQTKYPLFQNWDEDQDEE